MLRSLESIMKRAYKHSSTDGQESRRFDAGRRRLITQLAGLPFAAVWLRGASLARAPQQPPLFSPGSPYSRAFDFSTLKTWITPNPEFFVRSHFGIPARDGSPWMVKISGAVARPRAFTLDELMKMPSREEVVTLECAGNLVGFGGVSNARWTGISLGALLEAVGARQGAVEVVLNGADGGKEREAGGIMVDSFARSIPLAKAMDEHTLLAYRMNGEPLPPEHGGPLRAIVPGWYGMDSVKWLTGITVADKPFKGFYQTERYYVARHERKGIKRIALHEMLVKSQIARLAESADRRVAQATIIGAAWSGEARVERVELSFDGGRSWVEADLNGESAPFAWRLWSYAWKPQAAGSYEIIVRASDSLGRAQPLERNPLALTPYGNNWADRRRLEIK